MHFFSNYKSARAHTLLALSQFDLNMLHIFEYMLTSRSAAHSSLVRMHIKIKSIYYACMCCMQCLKIYFTTKLTFLYPVEVFAPPPPIEGGARLKQIQKCAHARDDEFSRFKNISFQNVKLSTTKFKNKYRTMLKNNSKLGIKKKLHVLF